MKKTLLILGLIATFFAYSCNNSSDNSNSQSDSTQNTVVDDNITTNDVNVDNTDIQDNNSDDATTTALKAQFYGISLGSDGAIISFRGEDGTDYEFFDNGNQQVKDVFADVDVTNPNDMTHIDEWYNLTYKQVTKTFYDGGSGQNVDRNVLVIVTIEPAAGTVTSDAGTDITLQSLTNTVFFGTENDMSWTLKFQANNITFTPSPGTDAYNVYYYENKNTCLNSISDNEVQIKATPDLDRGFIWTITIKRETCSDGMSDIDYPYSIHIQWEGGDEGTGCGRDL